MNLSVVNHYTVHYSRVGSGRRRRQTESGTAIFPASASSGVVSGLQEGQQYQFSVGWSGVKTAGRKAVLTYQFSH